MERNRSADSLVVLVLGMQRFIGKRWLESGAGVRGRVRPPRVAASEGHASRATRAIASQGQSGGGAACEGRGVAARGSRGVASSREGRPPPGEPSRSREKAVDWVARFTVELERIARVEGSGRPPQVVPSHAVPNVGANADVVLVNAQWMQEANEEICGDRASCRRDLVRGIAAHEWSHVVEARRGRASDKPDHGKELEADRTAGRILAQSGASAAPLLRLLGGDRAGPSLTHPSSDDRVDAVLAGQADAHGGCRGEGTCRCCDEGPRDADADHDPIR